VAVFRAREGVHAKRAARRHGEKRHRSPFAHFSYFYSFVLVFYERKEEKRTHFV
jgi:hypothetical protein